MEVGKLLFAVLQTCRRLLLSFLRAVHARLDYAVLEAMCMSVSGGGGETRGRAHVEAESLLTQCLVEHACQQASSRTTAEKGSRLETKDPTTTSFNCTPV
ncbi:hypothetical protein NDU88_001290 [Pleurodeles waltl]|uniref:Secreted protein n=1 Tax=Pleurodeles waltl TaxID=8319 RepID=A0AAV7S861_PLEWA|nr:hypothetical protein NDU88_001290 [Pleurodeles waltl]